MISIDEFKRVLAAIKAETQPIKGHSDPGAISDYWATVEEFIQQEYSTDEIDPELHPDLPPGNYSYPVY